MPDPKIFAVNLQLKLFFATIANVVMLTLLFKLSEKKNDRTKVHKNATWKINFPLLYLSAV